MFNLKKSPNPKSKLRRSKLRTKKKTINFLSWKFDKSFYDYKDFYSLESIWCFIKDFKWFILGVLVALLVLAFLPGKLWVVGIFTLTSYVTNSIDGVIKLPFKIDTGIAMIIMLAAVKANIIYILLMLIFGLVLPHIQTAYFFRPTSLMLYLWLIILLKLVFLLPFGFFINSLLGIIIFNFGFLGIASLNNIAMPFSRGVWSVLKNIFILLIVAKLGVMAVFN